MKFFGSIVLVLLSINVFAQINILIVDETSQKFDLGIDGFKQNDMPCTEFLVVDLDSSFHFLNLKIAGEQEIEFSKKVQFKKEGTYAYALVKNFKGRHQLRYRGIATNSSISIKAHKFNTDKAWFESKKEIAGVTNPSNSLANKLEAEPLNPPSLDSSISQQAINKPIDSSSSPSVKIVSYRKDTSLVANEEKAKVPEPNIASIPDSIAVQKKTKFDSTASRFNDFQQLIIDIKKEEFEFNKLNKAKNYLINHAISTKEVKRLFLLFKYDNTRIQFLGFAVERLSDPQNISQLENSFDYELSKEQFRKEFLP
jgi:hypothetical protein